MGLNRDGYYTRKDIDKYNCEWNVVYGERAPGKSFDIKRGGMELAWKTKKPVLGLIRRNKVDIETKEVEGYFLDRNINLVKEITNGEWEFISYWKKWLWWARTEEQPDGTMKYIVAGLSAAVDAVNMIHLYMHCDEQGNGMYEAFADDLDTTAATGWLKAGYSEEDAAKLAKYSALLQNTADEELSAADATSILVSQLKAYHMEADEAIKSS